MSVWNGKETMNSPGFVRGTSGLSDVLGLEGTCCGSLGTVEKKKKEQQIQQLLDFFQDWYWQKA